MGGGGGNAIYLSYEGGNTILVIIMSAPIVLFGIGAWTWA